MNRNKTKLNFCISLFILICLISTSCADKKTPSLIREIQKDAAQAEDQVKLRVIRSAAHIYLLEIGEIPKTLDVLVEKGYVKAKDIIDHNGEKFAYSPEVDGIIIKKCTACNSTVSSSSKPGDTCPHCGVVWTSESNEDL
jgi:hypothetical protein